MERLRFYGGVFLVTAATLMLQIIQTRNLSVVAGYYLAFFAISLAMFGLTAGAVWVYLKRERFSQRTLSHDLASFSAAFALATALSLAVQMTLSPVRVNSLTGLLTWAELAMCPAVPFFFAGVTVSLALTRSPYPMGRVYGVDLAGAAVGCLGVLAFLNLTDGPSAVLWTAALAGGAAVLFAGSGIGTAPEARAPLSVILGRTRTIAVVLVLAALANGLAPNGLAPVTVKGRVEAAHNPPMLTAWNSFSRIAVFANPSRVPRMWGPSPNFRPGDWAVEQRVMNIDGDAGTFAYRFDGDLANAGFLKYDVTNLAYFLPGRRSAAVIGVGGGRDVLGRGSSASATSPASRSTPSSSGCSPTRPATPTSPA